MDGFAIAAIITALAALVGSVAGPVAVVLVARMSRQLDEASRENLAATAAVHKEVKTINDQSLAQLADAGETRRVTDIPESDRTTGERHHMESVEEGEP